MIEAFSAYVSHPKKAKFEGQDKNEEIKLLLRRHFATNIKWIFLTLLMLILPIFLNFLDQEDISRISPHMRSIIAIVWYLVTLAYAFESFLDWYFNVYIITDKRVMDMDFWGLLHRNVSEANLENVQDITYKVSGLYPTLFNYGDVSIQTAAERAEFDFRAVPNPHKVHDKLTDWVNAKQNARRKRNRHT